MLAILTSIALLLTTSLFSKNLHKEKYYQEHFCKDGIIEYELPNKNRIDCLTKDYAIELGHPYSWDKIIGRSLYSARMTKRNPAIVLIIEKPKDRRHLKKILEVASVLKIKAWTIDQNLTIKDINYPHYYLKICP